jgi:hypothetical protein
MTIPDRPVFSDAASAVRNEDLWKVFESDPQLRRHLRQLYNGGSQQESATRLKYPKVKGGNAMPEEQISARIVPRSKTKIQVGPHVKRLGDCVLKPGIKLV